jgi:uncharacterized protein YjbJ (UPF0337 family)
VPESLPASFVILWREYCSRKIMEKNTLHLAAPWPQVKELLKEANSNLSDEDLEYEPGKEDELLERVSKIIGRDKDHVKAWIESVSSNKRPAF